VIELLRSKPGFIEMSSNREHVQREPLQRVACFSSSCRDSDVTGLISTDCAARATFSERPTIRQNRRAKTNWVSLNLVLSRFAVREQIITAQTLDAALWERNAEVRAEKIRLSWNQEWQLTQAAEGTGAAPRESHLLTRTQ